MIGSRVYGDFCAEVDGARVAVRGVLDGACVADRGLGAAFTGCREGALRWILLERGDAILMSDGPPRTSGPLLEREGALIARPRLGAPVRIIGRELVERGVALGALIERARGDADGERLLMDLGAADRLIERGAAERLLARGAERLGAERALPRDAEARLPPFERDWAAASGTVKASDRAAMIAAKVEVHAHLDRAADIVNLPSSRTTKPCGAKPSGP